MKQSAGPTPHPLQACVETVAAALDEAAGVDPLFLPTAAKADLLVDLAGLEARLAGLKLRVLANASDVAHEHGARSVASWLAHTTRTHPGACANEGRLASSLEHTYPATGTALREGRLNTAQARVITTALDALPAERLGPATMAEAEHTLIGHAADFGPEDLTRLARRILDVVAPDIADDIARQALEREEQAARAKTRLTTRSLGPGLTRITIDLPTPTAGILTNALHAHTSPRREQGAEGSGTRDGGSGDQRDPATGERLPHDQLMGRAFCALLEHLPVDRLPTHGRSPITVIVTVGLDQLRTDTGSATLTGTGTGSQDIDGDQISLHELRRLACETRIMPAVLDGRSQVLDLGRAQRFFTTAQRHAHALRHPRCQAQGCTIPATWCEAHHRREPWARGGTTDREDLALLCSHHHHRAHDAGYDHHWMPDGSVRYARRQ
ncbi:HNH endonuclease signature motif containing protein [Nocardioides pacificus]